MAQMVFDRVDECMHHPDDYYSSLHVIAKYPSQRELEPNCLGQTMGSKDIHVFGFPKSRCVTVSCTRSALSCRSVTDDAG